MNAKSFIAGMCCAAVLIVGKVSAIPIRLTAQPLGTNQVRLSFGPVLTNMVYEVMVRSNGPAGHWIKFAAYINSTNQVMSATHELSSIEGLSLKTLTNWTFVAGRWDDPYEDEMPTLYKELVLRSDPYAPGDPYGNPAGDGWNNLQKMQNDWDPLESFPPPPPSLESHINTNSRYPILNWEVSRGPMPDYFIIERAVYVPRPVTNEDKSTLPGPYGPRFGVRSNRMQNLPPNQPYFQGTNRPSNWPTNRPWPGPYNRPSNWPTNRPWPGPGYSSSNRPGNLPPNFRYGYRPPGIRREEPFVLGPSVEIARIPFRQGVSKYQYIDTNVDILSRPQYRVASHIIPPFRAWLKGVDTAHIRQTLINATVQTTTNGFVVTVPNPIPYAWYLLLVRDKNDPQWRASGYLTSATNQDTIIIHVDKKGMMTDAQKPIAMPTVKYLADVVDPEFVAGWGEDSDGDGLPDVYEVLVTQTDPDHADTGNTGVLDGYKVMAGDGWNNLEKFRRRVNPLKPAHPPSTIELKQPTFREIAAAMTPKSDLASEVELEIKTNGSTTFLPIEEVPDMLAKVLNYRDAGQKTFDLRVSWKFADPERLASRNLFLPRETGWLQAVEPLMERLNMKIVEAFRAQLETNPPVASEAAKSMMAAIEHSYRADEIDKGVAMAEMMLLSDNLAQDFYGKVTDQNGHPIPDATIKASSLRDSLPHDEFRQVKTDAKGLFQIAGLRGRGLTISVEKPGFQIQGHGVGTRNMNGPETSITNRALFKMWKLKGSEPMIHDNKTYKFKPDNRIYTIDLLSKIMSEGTNAAGDLLLQVQRPEQIERRRNFDWSFTMSALGGGFIQVTNDDYLNEAPKKGYVPTYSVKMIGTNSNWRSRDEGTFYLKSRNGKMYGHVHVNINPEARDGASLEIESYINPSGSRNLEFDPTNVYVPKVPSTSSTPIAPVPKTARIVSTNRAGQIVSWGSMVLPYVRPGTRFIAVAAGGEHSLAVTEDGHVIAWGRNLSGEANVPDGVSNVVAVAAGGRSNTGFSVALTREGRVFAWGDNQLRQATPPAGLSDVIAISAGTDHCLALRKDGTVVGWGFNEDWKAQSPQGLSNVVQIAAGGEHSLALKSDGTVVAWGRNQWGQTNVPAGLSNVVSISSGSYFVLAMQKDGHLVSWGMHEQYAGWGTDLPKGLRNVKAIAAGPWNAMALQEDGKLVVWGRDTFSPNHVPSSLSHVKKFAAGGSDHGCHCLAITQDGAIIGWGNNNYGQSLSPGGTTDVISVFAGIDHYLAIRSDGTLIGWGGQEHQGNHQAWVPDSLGGVISAAGGLDHSVALRDDGTAFAWGYDSLGQASAPGGLTNILSVVSSTTHSLALRTNGTVVGWGMAKICVVPAILTNATQIAAAAHHNLALRRDGTVFEWGTNGTEITTILEGESNIVAIAAGSDDHDLALTRDGNIVAWGNNKEGQSDVPAGLSNVIAIAAGVNHSLALRKNGTVVAWGANASGQSTVPPALSNVIAISAGGTSSAAIVEVTNSQLKSPLLVWLISIVLAVSLIVVLIVIRTFRGRKAPAM